MSTADMEVVIDFEFLKGRQGEIVVKELSVAANNMNDSLPHSQPPNWNATPFRPYKTSYSIYSQLPSIKEAVPLSAEDAPCRGDRDPLHMGLRLYICL